MSTIHSGRRDEDLSSVMGSERCLEGVLEDDAARTYDDGLFGNILPVSVGHLDFSNNIPVNERYRDCSCYVRSRRSDSPRLPHNQACEIPNCSPYNAYEQKQ